MVEEDTWEPRENLENVKDLVKKFEEKYSKNIGRSRRITEEEKRGELLGRYMAKILYGWDDKKFDQEYWEWLERNWRR